MNSTDQLSVSVAAARFAREVQWSGIPPAVTVRAKHLMLDAVGIALASTTYDFASPAINALSSLAGHGTSTVIGSTLKLPMRDAAMANGVLVHGIDYDDTHMASVVHTSASLLPVTLAVAQQHGCNGRDMISAYIVGTEVAARVGAVAQGGFHQAGFHPTGVVGAFAAALAAGRLIGLQEEELVQAQGIVLSFASGTFEFLEDGSWTKRLHPGWAAVSGITAAFFAQAGYRGVDLPYEGRFGLYATHLKTARTPAEIQLHTASLGKEWQTADVAVKPYPACHFTHACADAARALVAAGLDPSNVKKVRARVPEGVVKIVCEPPELKFRPKTAYDAQFSIPYVVAATLIRGRFGLAELELEALHDPAILSLARLVEYEVNPDAEFPKYYSGELVVETLDGKTLKASETINRGSPERPLSSDDIISKFMENAGRVATTARAQEILRAVLDLDQAPDLSVLAGLLGTQNKGNN